MLSLFSFYAAFPLSPVVNESRATEIEGVHGFQSAENFSAGIALSAY